MPRWAAQVRHSFLGQHLHDSDVVVEGSVVEQRDDAVQGCIRHGGNHAIEPATRIPRTHDRGINHNLGPKPLGRDQAAGTDRRDRSGGAREGVLTILAKVTNTPCQG